MEIDDLLELFGWHDLKGLGEGDLVAHVPEKAVMAGDDDLRSPSLRLDPEELELEGQKGGIPADAVDIGVDALDKGGNDLSASRVVKAQLLAEVASVFEQARPDVPAELLRPQDFGHGSGRLAPPEFELEEAVGSDVEALGEKEVVLVSGIDVGDAPGVADDLDGTVEAGDDDVFAGRRGDALSQGGGAADAIAEKEKAVEEGREPSAAASQDDRLHG